MSAPKHRQVVAPASGRHRAQTHRRPLVTAGVSALLVALAVVAATVKLGGNGASGGSASEAGAGASPATRSSGSSVAEARVGRGDRSRPTPRRTPRVPEQGSGEFAIVSGVVGPHGDGEVSTYRVEVEAEVPVRPGSFGRLVDRILADRRGWTADGTTALQRIDGPSPTMRILLATPATTDRLCQPLQTSGRLSCRNGQLVVINAWRWVNGAQTHARLAGYRRYLINHEVGHALGNGHMSCPAPGRPAPVMLQQTKSLEGCTPNSWPNPR